ncbi:UDP-4-amino-4,6-dideoxy-N-acetyl-beta-L-altrosamine transaminase [Planktothrix agardhii]|uniref:UDP-4-amino-4, 6-dideoxy-N-acetyl-beta-L-altrosamine transaminase n=1 Tax=Planktothrix agardhii TaxID=1160 RepID=UPI001F342204|nr:UDP-4-amino-4,6-dideoxy-N-acetyl-beta-L-altrosamine transaminase [Planktothrix agardhii]MCF3578733.1 UDP-4-amino-4,6-dideoxy-N-acetyl-beta-L-altrosamine transaminase [Planktothrix agardhii 1812]MCF3646710.1 UDP-4-amino-4,6-dideoxy-N-acetyl-beta-L-altrosamine transaminase [Planktothrix agardhii 1026]
MNQFIPYGRQDISQADIDAVVEVLRSDWITQGPAIERFEKSVAEYCGAKYAVAVSNATAGLHIACLAAGLSAGDVLWTSPNTFVASANCGLYCGADVDFVDIDPHTYNLSVEVLEQKLARAELEGKLPKVVVPVHFAGQSCEMERILALSRKYGFTILEDASHAIGARYQDNPVGSCLFSDMAVFSFHPVKIITTGEGGMVVTNREDLYEKLIRLRTHGITRNPELMQGESHGLWYYQQLELGFNYRMTDIQAALGASQMQRLDEFVSRRRHLAARYNQLLSDFPLVLPWQHPDTESSWHLYVIRLKLDEIGKTHRQVFEELRQAEIGVNLHYIPVHTQPYYQNLGFKWGDFPQAEQYYQEAISLPIYYGLSDENQDQVGAVLRNILSEK